MSKPPYRPTAAQIAEAKALLAEERPMGRVAAHTGIPLYRLRILAEEGGWLRRGRRQPYSAEVRVEAIRAYEQAGSMIKAAQMVGISRTILARWLRRARRPAPRRAITWRCYDCAPYGLVVEGPTCPQCGTVRFRPCDD